MNALELTSAITATANVLACNFKEEELALLASVFTQLGDTLATIIARDSMCKNQNGN
ncbi:MAG: DUF6774 domain-containing protein [Acutalibacteraceae bacterium]